MPPTAPSHLAPGFFELAVRSYCLHAGTSGPSHGDAYLYAPLKGPRAAVIEHVLQRSYSEQQVSQRDVQTLLWAIEAKAKPRTFATSTKAAAARLLSVEELGVLESEAVGVEEAGALERAAEQSAPLLRDAIMLDNQLRAS